MEPGDSLSPSRGGKGITSETIYGRAPHGGGAATGAKVETLAVTTTCLHCMVASSTSSAWEAHERMALRIERWFEAL